MEVVAALEAINALVKVVTVVSNSIDAQGGISKIIAERIAAGHTDWTDEQKAQVQDALDAARAYAVDQLGRPDAP
jgi:hypothetical protein